MTEIFGLLNIDKPGGYTSHDVVEAVRKATGLQKVGHAGTLDPMATGVLVLCLGAATRLSEYIMGQPKIYEATLRLGQTTDTYDADGMTTSENPTQVERTQLETVLPQFQGKIQQIPPMYSAIKQGGEKLYEKARRGEEVDLAAREVSVYSIHLNEFEYPYARLTVQCGSGTYIRSLAHDIGQVLEVGAHLTALRRTAIGSHFLENGAVPLANFQAAVPHWQSYLLDVSHGLSLFPRIELNNHEEEAARQGKFIELAIENDGPLQAWADDGYFIGILVRRPDGRWKPDKIFPAPELDV
ncbi:MAG: tRNA pseudouridine(55) synthase TruB [Anaerolineae bacterium]|jgi:tRNA pseudouridine55 synthase|nr:tRNA pseudouridine(55) synthase TruB [Anaerolineae bacterium]